MNYHITQKCRAQKRQANVNNVHHNESLSKISVTPLNHFQLLRLHGTYIQRVKA